MIVDMFGCDRRREGYAKLFNILFDEVDNSLAFDCLHQDMQVVIESGVLSA